MLSDQQVEAYKRDGVIVVPDVLDSQVLARMRQVVAELVAGAASTTEHTDIYDLEPGHTPQSPRVRRIKAPHKVHAVFDEVVRRPEVIAILKALLGPGLRLYGSKLNMKSAHYGSPVEWHQDWAFYPHTNDDVLAVGVLLDDTDLSNGPMLVSPGTHTGPVWNHHGADGRFAGLIDPDEIRAEIERSVPCMGRAGSMSFHHVRALHGSALNTSDRPRNLLLYEVAASDAWPLMGVKDFTEFDSRLLAGGSVTTPRMTAAPVRIPLPPPLRSGSIYETQSIATKSYFNRAA
ncbi:phytanoyl-CoA dioxygenase family protein [Reyranella soli]|jgi:ectoine hydroxylase-related dioxygenase (phytanoyl-CoA dioxygenase family)|uniref:Syringomycin biosynthesis enzyme n=1 Tax=Reyranella soli TaxID=1230389 RepID=A0A512NC99_9HYPH|nr:phytanoyl-CoA dioxygenase family protein [Reyranella soli]GEP56581.1 syringomycin biosynthesis enzyme [Reyranella soli]